MYKRKRILYYLQADLLVNRKAIDSSRLDLVLPLAQEASKLKARRLVQSTVFADTSIKTSSAKTKISTMLADRVLEELDYFFHNIFYDKLVPDTVFDAADIKFGKRMTTIINIFVNKYKVNFDIPLLVSDLQAENRKVLLAANDFITVCERRGIEPTLAQFIEYL